MRIRAKSFEAWMKANFTKEELQDIANHGADAGWHGLTYYKDTCKLYDCFKDEIWEALAEDADAFGNANIYELIASFTGAKHVSSSHTHENLLAWYMAERIARELSEDV